MSWTKNAISTASYKLHYKVLGATTWRVTNDLGDVNTSIITGLMGSTQYQVYVTAENSVGSSVPSNTVTETTLMYVPRKPVKPTVKNIRDDRLTFTWPAVPGVTYEVHY